MTKIKHLAFAALAVAFGSALSGCGGGDEKLLASARNHLDKKDQATELAAAKIDLKNLLQENPKSAAGRLLYGQVALAGGDPVNAEIELRRALELGATDNEVLPLLARALVEQGKATAMVAQFGKSELTDAAAAADLKLQIADVFLSENQLDDADAAAVAAQAKVPGHPSAIVLQARVKLARGDAAGATALVDPLLKAATANARAWSLKGDLLKLAKAPNAEVIAAYRKSLDADGRSVATHASLVAVLIEQGDTEGAGKQLTEMRRFAPGHPQTVFIDATLAMAGQDFKRARELCQTLLRMAPDNVRVLILAGQAELSLNSLTQAEALLGKAVALEPKNNAARKLLAAVYLRNGQADKALAALKPALDGPVADAQALSLAGQAYAARGDTKRAEQLQAQAASLQPDDRRLKTTRAIGNLAKGKDGALAEVQKLAAQEAGTETDMAVIAALYQRGDKDGALKAVDALAAKRPNSPEADYLRGRFAQLRDDAPAARAAFERSVAKDVSFMPAQAVLADMDMADGKTEAVKARFEAMRKHDPKSIEPLLALAQLANNTGASNDEVRRLLEDAVKVQPDNPTARLTLIDTLLANNDKAGALLAAQAAAAALPDNPDVLQRLGRSLQATGDLNRAASTFGRLVTLSPRSVDALLQLASVQMAMGNTASANTNVKKAMELAPNFLPAQQAAIAMALKQNQPATAVAVARSVQTQRPKEAVGFGMEGDIYASQKDYPAAIAAFRRALPLDRTAASVSRLHQVLTAAGKSDEAREVSSSWQKSHPDDWGFLLYRADQALANLDLDGASKLYRAVLDQQPNSVPALNNLATVLVRQAKTGAVLLAERAVRLAPNQPAILDTLAGALAAEQKLAKAIEVQGRAVQLAPDVGGYRLALAKFLIQSGEKSKAGDELDRLAGLGTKFDQQAEVADLRKSLKN